MKRIGMKYCLYILAFMFAQWLLKDVTIARYEMVFVFGLLLSFINMTLKPVLLILSIPINMLTVGLFTILINTWMVQIVDAMMKSIDINGFLPGLLIGSIIVLGYTFVIPKCDKQLNKTKKVKASHA